MRERDGTFTSMIGETISHYSIEEQIGAGGMGVVYRARDQRLERDVAVKVLSPALVNDRSFLERFRREARILSKLNHPNIATVHDFDTVDGTSFLVMEWIAGESLDQKVKIHPLAESEIIRLGTQLLQGLAAAHEGGVIHRDLKPSNLRETPDGRLKILDFGLARIVQTDLESTQSTTATAGVVGTLPYMSPEQLRAESLDARTDIYSVGVVLYELATGRRPFTEMLGPSLIDSILHREASPVRELNPRISSGLEAVILKALDKEPERRFRSAREMCAALQQVGTGSVAPRTESATEAVPSLEQSQAPPMEIAHVLFTDIVGYSKLPMDEQQRQLRRLQNLVRETTEFERARAQQQLISLPTGDGMALVFFGEPESAARCALELDRKLRQQPEIKLRMGINSGPVYRVADINANRNVAGGGINIAQRVMDCGDAGHILVSKAVADVLAQLSTWQGRLHDMGEVEVKHGVLVHIFNLYDGESGNAVVPEKVRRAKTSLVLPVSRWKRYGIVGSAVLLAGISIGVAVNRYRNTGQGTSNNTSVASRTLRPTFAVLGFKNLSNAPEAKWISASLADSFTGEIEIGNHLIATPGETVAKTKKNLALEDNVLYANDTVQRLRNSLHCDYLVYGSYFASGKAGGETVRVTLRLQDAKSGETLYTVSEEGTEAKLDDITTHLAAQLREKLQLSGISPAESEELEAKLPSTKCRKAFYAGLERLRNFDFPGARSFLEQAVQSDPNFALAHASLAEAWSGLGYDAKAREEAEKAFELSKHLSREEQRVVEARYREMSSQWDQAVAIYQSLWIVYPEKPEYALSAVDVLIRAGKGSDALKAVQSVRAQGDPWATDPRLDLKDADAFNALGEYAKAKDAAARAASSARERGERLLQAEALWQAGDAMQNLGDAAGAEAACKQSLEIARPMDDLERVARDLTVLAHVAEAQGNLDQALASHREALGNVRKIGSRRDIAAALTNIGRVLSSQGNHSAAIDAYQQGLADAQEIHDQSLQQTLLNNIAAEYQSAGKFSDALRSYRQSLDISRAIQDKPGMARALGNIGSILTMQGELSEALKESQEAVRLSEETGLKSEHIQFLYQLGDVKLALGDLDAAESNYQLGKKLAEDSGEKMTMAIGKLELGSLRQLQGKDEEALTLGQQAAADFQAQGMKDGESISRNLVASCLVDLGRVPEAAKELDAIKALGQDDPTIRMTAATIAGRLEGRSGQGAQAKKDLENVAQDAKRRGLPIFQYEARLAEGELGLFGGDKRVALSVLTALEREASRKGYKLYETRAKQMAAKISAARES